MATLKKQTARKRYECSNCVAPIEPGTEYYRFSLTRFQQLRPLCLKCKPTRSQTTTSDFFSTLYDIEDEIAGWDAEEMYDAQTLIGDIVSQLENLRDETQGKFDNIPENLQYAPVGELLQGRVDALEEMIGELENVDVNIDIEPDETIEPDEREDDVDEHTEERLNEILDEIQGITYNGE